MLITNKQFNALAEASDGLCVSIYIPTYRAGNTQADQIRFKNAIKDAVKQLRANGLEEKEALRFMDKAYILLDDDNFWIHLSDGIALFISEKRFEKYLLPIDFNPFVFVGHQFYLRPLLPMLNGESRFFLLALSQNEVRFFEGSRHSISPVIIEDIVPANMEEALALDVSGNDLQMHSGGAGRQTAIFHGQDLGSDHKLKLLKQYFRQVDDGLMTMLHDESAPMVIAAVDYLVPIYNEISKYSNLMDVHISGNPENDDPTLLHEKAWSIMYNYYRTRHQSIKDDFGGFLSEDRASFAMTDILKEVSNGRVATLFVNKNYHSWGNFDQESLKMEIHEDRKTDSIDFLEYAAKTAYLKGATVYITDREDMPRPTANLNAVYRY